jgi:N6-adenosine-specific RNA methylase IME4
MNNLANLTDQQLSFVLRQLELRSPHYRDSTMSNPTVRTARTGNWRRVSHPNCRIARIGNVSRACRPTARTSGIDSSRRDTSPRPDDRRQCSGS